MLKKTEFEKSYAFFFLVLFAVYLPVLQTHYLHTDDYFWSKWGEWNYKAVLSFMGSIGRPGGAILYWAFSKIQNFRDVYLFRLLAVLNGALIAWLLAGDLRKTGVRKEIAALLALIVGTLPSFQIFASYVSTLPHSVSVTLALLALRYQGRFFVSSLLLALAFSFNQVGALFFVVGIFTRIILCPPHELKSFLLKGGRALFQILAAGMFVYYIVFRIYLAMTHSEMGGKYDPSLFVQDYTARARWFFNGALFEAANLWNLHSRHLIPGILLAIFLGFWAVEASKTPKKERKWVGFQGVFALLCFPVGFAISLVSLSPSLEYRTYPVLGTLCLFLPALYVYKSVASNEKRVWFMSYILLLILFLGGTTANQAVFKFFAFPDSVEYRFVRNHIRQYLSSGKNLQWVHLIKARGPIAAPFEHHDFGEPTVRHEYNIRSFVLAALSETSAKAPIRITFGQDANSRNAVELLARNPDKVQFEATVHSLDSASDILIIDLTRVDLK